MQLEVAPQVAELLSDEQLSHLHAQATSGEPALCVRCGEVIEPDPEEIATLVLVSDPRTRRAAAQLSHEACGPSAAVEGDVPDPSHARLAWRWATFVLPRVPLVVLETQGGAWTDEAQPALLRMLESHGFGPARDAFDSSLFATGTGEVPRAKALSLSTERDEVVIRTDAGDVLDILPGAFEGEWARLVTWLGGALVAVSDAAALPEPGDPLAFEDLLPRLLDRGVAAWVSTADQGTIGSRLQAALRL